MRKFQQYTRLLVLSMVSIKRKKELYRNTLEKNTPQMFIVIWEDLIFFFETLFSRFSTVSKYFINLIKLLNKNIASSVLKTFEIVLLNLKKFC